jgi:Tfp pilus assembly protein PilF
VATHIGTRITPGRAQSAVDIETLGSTVLTWLQKHRALWLGFSGMLVLIVVSMWYLGHRKQVVLADLRTGIVELQGGDAEKAITYLEEVRSSSAIGTEAQVIGTFYLAEAYVKQERKEDAKKAYEEAFAFAKSGGEKARYLQQILLLRLGQDAVQRGEQAQARQWYDQAIAIEEWPLQSEALAQAGQVLEKANDRAAAASYYEKLTENDGRYPLAEVLKERGGK